MTALTDLLAKVERGRYARGNAEMPLPYSTFLMDCFDAGIGQPVREVLLDALHHGCAQYVLRALIAQEEA